MVYQDVYQRFIQDTFEFYKPNERETKAFEAIKEVTETADASACFKYRGDEHQLRREFGIPDDSDI
jgi:hypothetical protein